MKTEKDKSNRGTKDAPVDGAPARASKRGDGGDGQRPRARGPGWFLLIMFLLLGASLFAGNLWGTQSEIAYSFFLDQVEKGNVREVVFSGQSLVGKFKEPPLAPLLPGQESPSTPTKLSEEFRTILSPLAGEKLESLLQEHDVLIRAERPTDYGGVLAIVWLGLLGLMVLGVWFMIRRTRDQMMGGGMLSGVTKSPARKYDQSENRVTFDDVAGLEGVKRDLKEIVEFLEDPEKFQRLGARVPKGVLLMGPPGTGKTLLARAIAGEAGVPFFSINGSEFIQLFVGVGAGRVRDMFNTAKQAAPAILFIDEIDAVGRQRGAGMGGGHDEREQTLNQILSEMDGFSQTETVIVLAATNRPDVLDPALLRPGRFDRHVTVNRPSYQGRLEMFKVHTRKTPRADDVDLERLARATVGLTGADIRNLVNEAALWATRQNKLIVHMADFEYARDRILMGSLRDEVLTQNEKEITAYHEAGHTIVAWFVPGADPIHKVTIIPRGRALGVTQMAPDDDRHNLSEHEIKARLALMLAGRTAEKMIFDEYSAGAENDLQEATRLARRMVTHWGMSEKLGPVAYHSDEDQPFLGREMAHAPRMFSENTARLIDEEVAQILHGEAERAESLLTENRDKLESLALALLDEEELGIEQIEAILGPSVNGRRGRIDGHSDLTEAPEPTAAQATRRSRG